MNRDARYAALAAQVRRLRDELGMAVVLLQGDVCRLRADHDLLCSSLSVLIDSKVSKALGRFERDHVGATGCGPRPPPGLSLCTELEVREALLAALLRGPFGDTGRHSENWDVGKQAGDLSLPGNSSFAHVSDNAYLDVYEDLEGVFLSVAPSRMVATECVFVSPPRDDALEPRSSVEGSDGGSASVHAMASPLDEARLEVNVLGLDVDQWSDVICTANLAANARADELRSDFRSQFGVDDLDTALKGLFAIQDGIRDCVQGLDMPLLRAGAGAPCSLVPALWVDRGVPVRPPLGVQGPAPQGDAICDDWRTLPPEAWAALYRPFARTGPDDTWRWEDMSSDDEAPVIPAGMDRISDFTPGPISRKHSGSEDAELEQLGVALELEAASIDLDIARSSEPCGAVRTLLVPTRELPSGGEAVPEPPPHDFKSELNSMVMKFVERGISKGELSYDNAVSHGDGPIRFRSTLRTALLGAVGKEFVGEWCRTKKSAEHSAAEAALRSLDEHASHDRRRHEFRERLSGETRAGLHRLLISIKKGLAFADGEESMGGLAVSLRERRDDVHRAIHLLGA